MAYRRFTLPALKLTQRPTVGSKSIDIIHRGVNAHPCPDSDPDPGDHGSPNEPFDGFLQAW